MKQGKIKYRQRVRRSVRRYFGTRCLSFHPACSQCVAWYLHTPTWRKHQAIAGNAEFEEEVKS